MTWGGHCGVQVKDTMKFAPSRHCRGDSGPGQAVDQSRHRKHSAMTVLKRLLTKRSAEGFLGTDESMLVERLGHPVRLWKVRMIMLK